MSCNILIDNQLNQELNSDSDGKIFLKDFKFSRFDLVLIPPPGEPEPPTVPCDGVLAAELPLAKQTAKEATEMANRYTMIAHTGRGTLERVPDDDKYWFARLYDIVAYIEISEINECEHPAMVAHFIPIFFNLYRKSIESFEKGDYANVPPHWMSHCKLLEKNRLERRTPIFGAMDSIVSGATAHIQGDIHMAFVQAYKSFTNKYCSDNPPPLDYFRGSFFNKNAEEVFFKAQGRNVPRNR